MPFSARQGLFGQAAAEVPIDADVSAWAANVATADGQSLESGVISAVNTFVTGVKSDGDWTNLDQILVLSCARTVAGAAVPLKGTAPTFNNITSGDYNRTTGILGDEASDIYINSNYAMNTWSPSNIYVGAYQTAARLTRATTGNANEAMFARSESVTSGNSFHLLMNESPQFCVVTRYFNSSPLVHNSGGTGTQVDYNHAPGWYALYSDNSSNHTVSGDTQNDTQTQTQGSADTTNLFYYRRSTTDHYSGRMNLAVAGNYINNSNFRSRADTLYSDIVALGL
jgi:hypothetical protein